MDSMRAEPCASLGEHRHLPALPGAGRYAHFLQRQRQQTGRHLLAGRDHRVILARVVQLRGFVHPADEFVGLAGHGRDDDGDLMAGLRLAAHMGGHVADALYIGDGRAAEFHHQPGHAVSIAAGRLKPWGRIGLKARA